jgi:hypothetical protein
MITRSESGSPRAKNRPQQRSDGEMRVFAVLRRFRPVPGRSRSGFIVRFTRITFARITVESEGNFGTEFLASENDRSKSRINGCSLRAGPFLHDARHVAS